MGKIGRENIAVLFMQCAPEKLRDSWLGNNNNLAYKLDTSIYGTQWWRYLWDPELIEALAQNSAERGDAHTFEFLKDMMANVPTGRLVIWKKINLKLTL